MSEVLGHGVYSLSEAAKLLGVSPQKVAGWFRGWPRGREPLFESDYKGQFAHPVISFLDLFDVSVAVILYKKHSVSISTIRKLTIELSKLWKSNHPFCREEFYTDDRGRQIFIRLATEHGEEHFMDILAQQHAMPSILLPFLTKVEYNERTRLAQRLPLTDRVVLDPRRKYGKPIVTGTGMPTSVLYQCYLATKCIDTVADWYSVEPLDVQAAISFESEFTGIAA